MIFIITFARTGNIITTWVVGKHATIAIIRYDPKNESKQCCAAKDEAYVSMHDNVSLIVKHHERHSLSHTASTLPFLLTTLSRLLQRRE